MTLLAKNLGKIYRGKKIINNITIEISPSKIIGLLGPNGAGKTTAFNIIAGLITAEHGNVFLESTEITKLPMYARARMGLGYLPQESSIFRDLTVEENIMVAVERVIKDKEKAHFKIEELMEEFHITHLRNINASVLSGGERRRTEIARCLGSNPQYILLDEPLAGIDPIAVSEIQLIIKQLKKRNIGVLITDHNIKEAFKILDYAYVIYDGSILAHGSIKDIVKNNEVREYYLGKDFIH